MSTTPDDLLKGFHAPQDDSVPPEQRAEAHQPKEPEENAPPPSAPPVELTPQEKAAQEQSKREKIAAKTFKDDKRSAIAGRHSTARTQAADAFRQENAAEAAHLEQVAGTAPSPDLLARLEAEVSGEDLAPPSPESPPAPAPLNPVAAQTRAYKIRYYGQERDASEEEVIQAGVAALQKQHAGELRLQDAATREAQLRDWEAQLRTYAETLRTPSVQGGTPDTTGGSTTPQPPDPGAAGQEVNDLRLKAAQALLQGDDTKYAELSGKADQLFFDAITRATAPKQRATQSSEQGAVPEPPARPTREPWSREDRIAINQVFEHDFADLLADDDAFEHARWLMERELSKANNLGRQPAEIAQAVGKKVRAATGTEPPAPQPSVTQQTLEQRRTLKAQIPLTPPAGSGRVELGRSAPPNRQQANKAYVQQLRRRSGSNSSGV